MFQESLSATFWSQLAQDFYIVTIIKFFKLFLILLNIKSWFLHENCLFPFWTQRMCRLLKHKLSELPSRHCPSTLPSWHTWCRTPPWWRSSSPARTSSCQAWCLVGPSATEALILTRSLILVQSGDLDTRQEFRGQDAMSPVTSRCLLLVISVDSGDSKNICFNSILVEYKD